MTREQLAKKLESIGRELADLREELLEATYIYTAGMVRSSEEGLLEAVNGLANNNVPEAEL